MSYSTASSCDWKNVLRFLSSPIRFRPSDITTAAATATKTGKKINVNLRNYRFVMNDFKPMASIAITGVQRLMNVATVTLRSLKETLRRGKERGR